MLAALFQHQATEEAERRLPPGREFGQVRVQALRSLRQRKVGGAQFLH